MNVLLNRGNNLEIKVESYSFKVATCKEHAGLFDRPEARDRLKKGQNEKSNRKCKDPLGMDRWTGYRKRFSDRLF
ncbi:hypothetical protein N7488_008564 [Penicillium malachiteum]|nr:hypothetical protein N7488_008564 [Penicillium malachiteum]